MFSRSPKIEEEEMGEVGCFADKVKCVECKHWLDKDDAQYVQNVSIASMFLTENEWYCPMHKKPYDRSHYFAGFGKFYREIEVEEDGTPVGYEKKKKK